MKVVWCCTCGCCRTSLCVARASFFGNGRRNGLLRSIFRRIFSQMSGQRWVGQTLVDVDAFSLARGVLANGGSSHFFDVRWILWGEPCKESKNIQLHKPCHPVVAPYVVYEYWIFLAYWRDPGAPCCWGMRGHGSSRWKNPAAAMTPVPGDRPFCEIPYRLTFYRSIVARNP